MKYLNSIFRSPQNRKFVNFFYKKKLARNTNENFEYSIIMQFRFIILKHRKEIKIYLHLRFLMTHYQNFTLEILVHTG